MPIPPAVIAAGISAIPALVKGVQGIFQGAKGAKLAKKNIRPTYEIPQEFQQNLAIAENMGRVGLPQQQYTQGLQNIQRGQTAGLRQIGRMGRGGNVAGLARAGMDATLGLDVADANARMANQRAAMGYRSQIGQQQLAKQQWDKFGKYQEDAAAAEALQGAGRQNVMGGLTDLANIGMTTIAYGDLGGGGKKKPPLLNNSKGMNIPSGFNPKSSMGGFIPNTSQFGGRVNLPNYMNVPYER